MTKPYMLTASGKHFDLLNPKPEQVDHNDIFAAISKLCRFTGHCARTYTVGHHSLLVMSLAPKENRLEALMHDADEAYTGDVSTPQKIAMATINDAFDRLARQIKTAVREKYGLPAKLSPAVKKADISALCLEKHWLMPEDYEEWAALKGVEMPRVSFKLRLIRFLPGGIVRLLLLYHFNRLTKGQFK